MRYSDPRLWAIRYPWSAVALFSILTLFFVWGNARLKKGGMLDENVILCVDDPIRLMDRSVRAKGDEGFEGREVIPFIFHGELRSVENLLRVARFTEAAKAAFGDGVGKLAASHHCRLCLEHAVLFAIDDFTVSPGATSRLDDGGHVGRATIYFMT